MEPSIQFARRNNHFKKMQVVPSPDYQHRSRQNPLTSVNIKKRTNPVRYNSQQGYYDSSLVTSDNTEQMLKHLEYKRPLPSSYEMSMKIRNLNKTKQRKKDTAAFLKQQNLQNMKVLQMKKQAVTKAIDRMVHEGNAVRVYNQSIDFNQSLQGPDATISSQMKRPRKDQYGETQRESIFSSIVQDSSTKVMNYSGEKQPHTVLNSLRHNDSKEGRTLQSQNSHSSIFKFFQNGPRTVVGGQKIKPLDKARYGGDRLNQSLNITDELTGRKSPVQAFDLQFGKYHRPNSKNENPFQSQPISPQMEQMGNIEPFRMSQVQPSLAKPKVIDQYNQLQEYVTFKNKAIGSQQPISNPFGSTKAMLVEQLMKKRKSNISNLTHFQVQPKHQSIPKKQVSPSPIRLTKLAEKKRSNKDKMYSSYAGPIREIRGEASQASKPNTRLEQYKERMDFSIETGRKSVMIVEKDEKFNEQKIKEEGQIVAQSALRKLKTKIENTKISPRKIKELEPQSARGRLSRPIGSILNAFRGGEAPKVDSGVQVKRLNTVKQEISDDFSSQEISSSILSSPKAKYDNRASGSILDQEGFSATNKNQKKVLFAGNKHHPSQTRSPSPGSLSSPRKSILTTPLLRQMTMGTKKSETQKDDYVSALISEAFEQSQYDYEIEQRLIDKLSQLNEKFLDQAQKNQLKLIFWNHEMVQGSKKFETMIKEGHQQAGTVPAEVPQLENLKNQGRKFGPSRIKEYESKLNALETGVIQELITFPVEKKKPNKAKHFKKKGSKGSTMAKTMEVPADGPTALSKDDILENLRHWKNKHMIHLLRSGIRMKSNQAGFKLDNLNQLQQLRLYKLMDFEHKRQQDALVYRLGKQMLPDRSKSPELPHISPVAGRSQHQANLEMSKIEEDFIYRFKEAIKDHMTSFVQDQEKEVDFLLQQFNCAEFNKRDRQYKEFVKILCEHQLKQQKGSGNINQEDTKPQDEIIREYLMERVKHAIELPLDEDLALSHLAMLHNKKPNSQMKQFRDDEENQELNGYLNALKQEQHKTLQKQNIYHENKGIPTKNSTPNLINLIAEPQIGETGLDLLKFGEAFNQSIHLINLQAKMQTYTQRNNAHYSSTSDSKFIKNTQGSLFGSVPSLKTILEPPQNAAILSHSVSGMENTVVSKASVIKHVSAFNVFKNKNLDQGVITEQVKDNLVEKVKGVKIRRHVVTKQKAAEIYQNDPFVCYFKQCMDENEIDLPILEIVHSSHLNLQNYLLRNVHCKAMLKALQLCQNMERQFFNSVILVNNKLKDEDLCLIIEGLNSLQYMKKLHITSNQLGLQSINQLKALLKRRPPFQLKQLVLSDCKLGPNSLNTLLDVVNYDSNLYQLSLSKVAMNSEQLLKVVKYVEESSSLKKFALQWCNLTSMDGFMPLLECISKNRRLKNVNLSWNNLANQNRVLKSPELMLDYQLKAAQMIVNFFKFNKKLMHFDISNTGLTMPMFQLIAANLKKAMSMVALHLSNNPFIREISDYQEIIKTLNAKPLVKASEIVFFPEQLQILKPSHKQELFLLNEIFKRLNVRENEVGIQDPFTTQQFVLQRKLGHKLDIPLSGQWELLKDDLPSKDFNYGNHQHEGAEKERYTDEDDCIAGTGRKRKYCRCWYCHQYQYAIIFWSDSIQFHIQNENKNLQQQYLQPFVKNLHFNSKNQPLSNEQSVSISELGKQFQSREFLHSHIKNSSRMISKRSLGSSSSERSSAQSRYQIPTIYLEENNWKPIKMVEVLDFIALIDPENSTTPDILQRLKDMGKIPQDIKNRKELTRVQKKWYQNETAAFENTLRKKWASVILQKSQYNKPLLVNAELAYKAVKRKEHVFMHACFLKPGKRCAFITQSDEFHPNQVEKTLQTFIVGVREEPIPLVVKPGSKKNKERKFKKDGSVFSPWKPDNENLYTQILENHDFQKWKVGRFIKDENERDMVKNFFRRHIYELKEIYANLQGESTAYPGISQLTFSDFCQNCGMIDKSFHISTADRLFISANFNDSGNSGLNNAKEMLRFEFLEILVRVARVKYIETSICQNYGEALEHLYHEELCHHTQQQGWQIWREKVLWQLPVQDVMEFNIDNLKKFYQIMITTYKQQRVSYDEVIRFLTQRCNIKLTEKTIRYCYAMSKMTIVNEEFQKDQYLFMNFVEFLEMLGRLAHAKFEGTHLENEPLAQKVEFLLDQLFPLIGVERVPVVTIEEDLSESDQDY